MLKKHVTFVLFVLVQLFFSVCFAKQVWIDSGKLRLDGELVLPTSEIKGTLIFVGGSGSSEIRNYTVGFRETLLEAVVRPHSYAVLYMNKRGLGQSEGKWQFSSIESRADDLQAAIRFVRQHTDLSDKPVAIAGHSQGGWVVQEVAGREPNLQFALSFAGPVVSVAEQDLQHHRLMSECEGASVKEQNRTVLKRDKAHKRMQFFGKFIPFFQLKLMANILPYDPRQSLRESHTPLLLAFAGNDIMADAEPNMTRLNELFPTGLPENITVHVEAYADHLFRIAEHRCVEYTSNDDRDYSTNFVAYLSQWVSSQISK